MVRVGRAAALGGGELFARGVGGGARLAHPLARGGLGGGGLTQRRGEPRGLLLQRLGAFPRGLALLDQLAEPVLLHQPARGGRGSLGGGGKAVPAPQVALAADKPLAGLQPRRQRRPLGAGDDADLGEAAGELRRGLDVRGEAGDAVRQRRIAVRLGPGPARGRAVGRRGVEIVAQRGAERGLVATRRDDLVQHRRMLGARRRAEQLLQRARLGLQPLRELLRVGQGRAGAGFGLARGGVALLGVERGAFRVGERLHQLFQRGGGILERGFVGHRARQRVALAAQRRQLLLEPAPAPDLLVERQPQRVALRGEIGGSGLRGGERGLRLA